MAIPRLVKHISAFFLILPILFSSLEASDSFDKRHILYLMSTKKVNKAIDQYLKHYEKEKKHDFKILTQMAQILIDLGSNSKNLEEQIFTLFGISLCGNPSLAFLENALKSPFPMVQIAALDLLAQQHDDLTNDIIAIALKSRFLNVRMEALHHLINRKAKQALGHVESLANLLPSQFRPLFVELFAVYNSHESIQKLKQLFSDRDLKVRLSTILIAARYQRDDLLVNIRSALTQPDPLLKEAASCSLGILKDLSSEAQLKIAAESPFAETKLAASFALHQLGNINAKEKILELAIEGNPFAISLCGHIPQSYEILKKLLHSKNTIIQLNAGLALLQNKKLESLPIIKKILAADTQFDGFMPFSSPGRSLTAWKYISPAMFPVENAKQKLQAISNSFQEELLQKCLDLPEEKFLEIAHFLLDKKQNQLVPLLVRLLENLGSPKAVTFLNQKANQVGSPFVRAYCQLALYRLGESQANRTRFLKWLAKQHMPQLIEFKPMLDRGAREDKNISNYTLSPKETTALLIESFDAIATKHDIDGITLILKAMRGGHAKNRFALAGLLLKSIQ